MHARFLFFIYTLISISSALSSCYREIDLDKYRNEAGKDILALNSIITPDSVIAVSATQTYFFSDKHRESISVSDLDIQLSINGDNVGLLEYDPSRQLYMSHIKPNVEDVVEISTVYMDKTVFAKECVPKDMPIENITVTLRGPFSDAYSQKYYSFIYNITFTDNADEENYYFFRFNDCRNPKEPWKSTNLGSIDYSHSIVFQKLKDYMGASAPSWLMWNYPGLPFSDAGINGDRHSLTVIEDVKEDVISSEMKRDFKLFAINKAYYDYIVGNLMNIASIDDTPSGMIDLGLADPIRTFSNIHNGIGVFGCYTLSQKQLDVLPLVFPANGIRQGKNKKEEVKRNK